MEELFRGYWWLMFPIIWCVFGAFHMAMRMIMHRDRMALLRAYAEKGEAPPADLAGELCDSPYAGGYGRRSWRYRSGLGYWGSYWGPARAVRRFVFFLAVCLGLLALAFSDGGPREHHGVLFLAVVAGAFAAGSLVMLPMMGLPRGPGERSGGV